MIPGPNIWFCYTKETSNEVYEKLKDLVAFYNQQFGKKLKTGDAIQTIMPINSIPENYLPGIDDFIADSIEKALEYHGGGILITSYEGVPRVFLDWIEDLFNGTRVNLNSGDEEN